MPKEKELWRDFIWDGLPSAYQVSNTGKVRSRKRCNVHSCDSYKLLTSFKNAGGYCVVGLSRNCAPRAYLIHRMVALSWIENENPEKKQINHIDGNKYNNSVSNLEWCTQAENNKHARETGLWSPNPKRGLSPCSKSIIGQNESEKRTILLPSTKKGVELGFDYSTIASAARATAAGKNKLRYGFKWQYI